MGYLEAMRWWTPYLVTPAAVALAAVVYFAADFQHGWDQGHEQVDIARLEQGYRPATRNLVVQGIPQMEFGVRRKVTRDGHQEPKVHLFLPIVSPSWDPQKPVSVIYQTGFWSQDDLDRLQRGGAFEGVAQTAFLEGLQGKTREFLESELKVRLADDALLVWSQRIDGPFYFSRTTLQSGLIALLVAGYLISAVAAAGEFKKRKKAAEPIVP